MAPVSPHATLQAAAILALASLALSACGTYEPPKPGVHRGPGEAQADIICSYDTPTASRFTQMRCDRREDAQARSENQQRDIDSVRTSGPLVK